MKFGKLDWIMISGFIILGLLAILFYFYPQYSIWLNFSSWTILKIFKLIQNPKSEVRFIVGTPQTGGYGITLTGASTMIYYSNGYDLEKRQQSEARIDRIGQEKPMTYIDIIAEGTVDEKIVKALRTKVDIATQIMGEELKEWI
jgi:SNF2 family DNA or RNA helicase